MLCARLVHGARKPRVSAFTTADVPKIVDLKPDLVLTFSDLQADIAVKHRRWKIPDQFLRCSTLSSPKEM